MKVFPISQCRKKFRQPLEDSRHQEPRGTISSTKAGFLNEWLDLLDLLFLWMSLMWQPCWFPRAIKLTSGLIRTKSAKVNITRLKSILRSMMLTRLFILPSGLQWRVILAYLFCSFSNSFLVNWLLQAFRPTHFATSCSFWAEASPRQSLDVTLQLQDGVKCSSCCWYNMVEHVRTDVFMVFSFGKAFFGGGKASRILDVRRTNGRFIIIYD